MKIGAVCESGGMEELRRLRHGPAPSVSGQGPVYSIAPRATPGGRIASYRWMMVNGSYWLLQDWTANQVGKPKPPLHKLHQKCSEAPPRRTNRTNAGRHHNLHHQPQAAGSRAIGATNSQV
ncbi:unnamed protein product [Boreogadus saida]